MSIRKALTIHHSRRRRDNFTATWCSMGERQFRLVERRGLGGRGRAITDARETSSGGFPNRVQLSPVPVNFHFQCRCGGNTWCSHVLISRAECWSIFENISLIISQYSLRCCSRIFQYSDVNRTGWNRHKRWFSCDTPSKQLPTTFQSVETQSNMENNKIIKANRKALDQSGWVRGSIQVCQLTDQLAQMN